MSTEHCTVLLSGAELALKDLDVVKGKGQFWLNLTQILRIENPAIN